MKGQKTRYDHIMEVLERDDVPNEICAIVGELVEEVYQLQKQVEILHSQLEKCKSKK